ncbi:hypothetical protein AVEN_160978-1 [Araneus ventricosus]|uniref:Uncharacterized protein n=1 Tax=Araneus ventricosus TaxID=182803 RepID=A0A4Y2T930_ARAVE|nr:hypothetical protein AVEN_160978-1 [Araneus ventricosus]
MKKGRCCQVVRSQLSGRRVPASKPISTKELPRIQCQHLTRLKFTSSFKTGKFGRKRHELDSPNLGGHLPHHRLLYPSLKAHGNWLRFARIIGPPTPLISLAISEPHLNTEEANRLKPAIFAVEGKFLDRTGPPRSVLEG